MIKGSLSFIGTYFWEKHDNRFIGTLYIFYLLREIDKGFFIVYWNFLSFIFWLIKDSLSFYWNFISFIFWEKHDKGIFIVYWISFFVDKGFFIVLLDSLSFIGTFSLLSFEGNIDKGFFIVSLFCFCFLVNLIKGS